MADFSFVIPGRGAAANPEPMHSDGAGELPVVATSLSKVRVHGFRVQPCGLSRNDRFMDHR
jgi:hypothetical protein